MRRIPVTGLMIAAALWLLAARPAGAGTSFDFLFSMDHVSNDNQLFLNLTVSNLGYNRAAVEPILPRISNVEVDLPVVLFLAHESGRPPGYIAGLRGDGLGWSVIFQRCGVPVDVLFTGFEADPGPPYGKAWGSWRRDPRDVRLADGEIRDLVQIQLGSRWAGVSQVELARARGEGRTVPAVVAERKGRAYHGSPHEGEHGKGKGHGHGKS